eukprot:2159755-Pleurochrysis_carterae.AAC.1
MNGATENLVLTLATIRDEFCDFEALEDRRNIELDKRQGRAFVAKQLRETDRSQAHPQSSPPRNREKLGDPSRHTPNKNGPWTNQFVKCRHCGGTHWHRDCPKRHKSKSDKGQQSK